MNRLSYSPVAINFAWLWWSPMASEALPYGKKFSWGSMPQEPHLDHRMVWVTNNCARCARRMAAPPPTPCCPPRPAPFFNIWIRPCVPPSEKQSAEQSQISCAYSQKVVRTNEIARSVIDSLTKIILLNCLYLFWVCLPQNTLNVARLHCHQSMCKPKKFNLLHQILFPCGNETGQALIFFYSYLLNLPTASWRAKW